jgi:crossover junction endodeoxyribonuclease RusA
MRAEFFIPWPSRDLSPNSRKHHMVVARAKKAARMQTFALARSACVNELDWPKEGRLVVWITGYASDRRRRDADNLLASMKGHLDGLADAMGVDDRRFTPAPYVSDEIRKPAVVRICVTTGPQADA